MYLKNTSNTVSVVINTIRGKVGIKPQEIADIKYKILPPVSRSLTQVSEEEYLSFCEKRDGVIETIIKNEKPTKTETIKVVEEEKLNDLERMDDEVRVETKDAGIMGFVNSLLEQKVADAPAKDEVLVVNETNSEDEASAIEQQIEDLKASWKSARSANKKAKIQKDIKELQKQLKKIKK